MTANPLSPSLEEKIDALLRLEFTRATDLAEGLTETQSPVTPEEVDAARDSLRDAIRELEKDSERLSWMIEKNADFGTGFAPTISGSQSHAKYNCWCSALEPVRQLLGWGNSIREAIDAARSSQVGGKE